MVEQPIFSRRESKILLLPSPDKLIDPEVSQDFFVIEEYLMKSVEGRRLVYGLESECKRWLENLQESQNKLGYQERNLRGETHASHAKVQGVLPAEHCVLYARKAAKSGLALPDFIVVLENNEGLMVGGYDVKRSLESTSSNDKRQIKSSNTTALINASPSIQREVNKMVKGRAYRAVDGVILVPDLLKNIAYSDPLTQLSDDNGTIIFPQMDVYPYSVSRMQKSYEEDSWKLGMNISLFPSDGNLYGDIAKIARTAYAFGISVKDLDRKNYFSKRTKVSKIAAIKSNLSEGEDITLAVPYTGWEVLQMITSAAQELQCRELDLAKPYPEFLRQFEDLSIFSFMQVLSYELNRGKKNVNGNGRRKSTVYHNGNGNGHVPIGF